MHVQSPSAAASPAAQSFHGLVLLGSYIALSGIDMELAQVSKTIWQYLGRKIFA